MSKKLICTRNPYLAVQKCRKSDVQTEPFWPAHLVYKLCRNVWVCMNILDCTQPILLTVQSCHCRNLTVFAVIHYYLTDSVHISVAHMFIWQHLSVCVMLATDSVYI